MYLSELVIRNFRQFGDNDGGLVIALNRGVTAFVGPNDSGKTTIIDAIRYALLTRDYDPIRVQREDFHVAQDGQQAEHILIRCKLSGLTDDEKGAFLEYLTLENADAVLYVNWSAKKNSASTSQRRWVDVTVRSGKDGSGPSIDILVRQLLATAYLRPLRDAEREMAAGRGSRLSEILFKVPEITQGSEFKPSTPPTSDSELSELSLVGHSDFFRHSIERHPGISSSQVTVNDKYLRPLQLKGDQTIGKISFADGGTADAKLRQILERLELRLVSRQVGQDQGKRGLGSNNILFIACELLLLGQDTESLAILLIEEPEAHLHPQRQLRLMDFLEQAATASQTENLNPIQVILSTHSPNLASRIGLSNLVMLQKQKAYSLAPNCTRLAPTDYRFLERFLDVTKANLFFAHGVVIVEGDAEEILLPTIAKLIGKDFSEHGVSIVNVGGKGLSRYGRIFQRASDDETPIPVRVACVVDLDIMPDCAPKIFGKVEGDDDPVWDSPRRRWRAARDFDAQSGTAKYDINAHNQKLRLADGQNVRTFVSDSWTFEYALAFSGLNVQVAKAVALASADDSLVNGTKEKDEIAQTASTKVSALESEVNEDREMLCSRIYQPFDGGLSKPIAAQYLAEILSEEFSSEASENGNLRDLLPQYLVNAIDYVTEQTEFSRLTDGQAVQVTRTNES